MTYSEFFSQLVVDLVEAVGANDLVVFLGPTDGIVSETDGMGKRVRSGSASPGVVEMSYEVGGSQHPILSRMAPPRAPIGFRRRPSREE